MYEKYEIGDKSHLQNMEHMAEEIKKCLSKTQYGGKQCLVMREIGNDKTFVFDDEEELVTFLGKTEGRKYEDLLEYIPVKNELWREVATLWNLDEDFTGSYSEDYQVLQNALQEEAECTCWSDKYSTTIINPDVEHEFVDRMYLTIQPIPDYVRWLRSGGEMHYLSLETQQKLDSGQNLTKILKINFMKHSELTKRESFGPKTNGIKILTSHSFKVCAKRMVYLPKEVSTNA